MKSELIRQKFLEFFKKRGHTVVPSSSLIPDDPSVLLTTAGMQQFKPYYTGKADPIKDFGSENTASIQKCFRTSDIDEVGDESHLTFFEMLGNFSFGGYFKEEAIEYAYEFITSADWMSLKIDHVSVFGGDPSTNSGQVIPADEESGKIWKSLGVKDVRKAGRGDNFWGPTGAEGPCGPTAEIYVNGVEVWNLVFNEYYKKADGKYEKLKTPGIDTGMGLERLAAVSQNVPAIFETDLFKPLLTFIENEFSKERPPWSKRIVIDHSRGIVFLIADGVMPSNKDSGYVLRRLIGRAISHLIEFQYFEATPPGGKIKEFHYFDALSIVIKQIIKQYSGYDGYGYLRSRENNILDVVKDESDRYLAIMNKADKILTGLRRKAVENKSFRVSGEDIFQAVSTYGIPIEWIKDVLGKMWALELDIQGYEVAFRKHQEISRAGAEKKFGGHGLILDTGELKAGNEEEVKKVTRLHTVTHLMNQALHDVLGDVVDQRGSDITPERTRFDFVFPRKLAPEEVKKIERIVNEKIEADLPVRMKEMPVEEALTFGVRKFYKAKYPPVAKVYYIGADDSIKEAYSKEFCGGPHVKHTSEIGKFRIIKEEASSASVRRIRGVVE